MVGRWFPAIFNDDCQCHQSNFLRESSEHMPPRKYSCGTNRMRAESSRTQPYIKSRKPSLVLSSDGFLLLIVVLFFSNAFVFSCICVRIYFYCNDALLIFSFSAASTTRRRQSEL